MNTYNNSKNPAVSKLLKGKHCIECKGMDIYKKLPIELQQNVYNDYLESQREYHINRFHKNIKLNNNVKYFNSFITEILTHYYYYDLIDDESNAIKNGVLLPFDTRDILRNIKEYQEDE